MRLSVHEAQINTATVEVKTLTISGKQVTLAVFRQLQEESLIDDDGRFRGLPWGTVNYHPDGCKDSTNHRHVVWQDGNELRRAYVRSQLPAREIRSWWGPAEADAWLDVVASMGWVPNGGWNIDYVHTTETCVYVKFVADAPAIACTMSAELLRAVRHSYQREERLADLRREIAPAGADHLAERRQSLEQIIVDWINAEVALQNRHAARWQEVLALPQLFIAV